MPRAADWAECINVNPGAHWWLAGGEIAPDQIGTEKYHTMIHSAPEATGRGTRHEQMHPVGRVRNPEDIAALCAFLASPTSGFISGTTLHVDGGLSALLPQLE